jgi:hypothetical protein
MGRGYGATTISVQNEASHAHLSLLKEEGRKESDAKEAGLPGSSGKTTRQDRTRGVVVAGHGEKKKTNLETMSK